MNDCPRGEIRDLLPDLMAGSLDDGTRARVEEHLHSCAECAAELELLRVARTALSRAPAMDIAKIAGAVRGAKPAVARTTASKRDWRVAALAAAVALMVTGALWLSTSRERQSQIAARGPDTVAAPNTTVAPSIARTPVPNERGAGRTPPPAPPTRPSPGVSAAEVAVAIVSDPEMGDAELDALLDDIRSLDGLTELEPSEELPSLPAVDGDVQR
ncbi:MAG TPA: zf-HC2 domain-containing protein [Gemmatimonadaceae bacterium]|nr:zf-HC2 domain-containing protein [Gemmatimonadaceae bacterium]